SFDTNKEQYQELIPMLEKELRLIAQNGVTEDQLLKSREFLIKNNSNTLEHNSGVVGYVSALLNRSINYEDDYATTIEATTSNDITAMARDILSTKNRIEVVMLPN
ncbi:MAG: hypothetical protein SNH13_02545, partial [Rikenellaceae bacterium]